MDSHLTMMVPRCLSRVMDGDDVNEYTLSTAWNVSTASFVDSFSTKSEDGDSQGM